MHSNLVTPVLRRSRNMLTCTAIILMLCAAAASTAQASTEDDFMAVERNISALNYAIIAQQAYIQNLAKSIDPAAYAADAQYKAQMDAYIAQQTKQANEAINKMQTGISTLRAWQRDNPVICPPEPSYCGLNMTGQ